MNGKKLRVKQAILCEGRYDKIKLADLFDTMILTTEGFGIFNNEEKRALLRRLCETRGLIVLTDSDKAGFFIRNKLKGMLPQEGVTHLYIPAVEGKERRKAQPSKQGLLGVEGIDADTIRDLFYRAGLVADEEAPEDENEKSYLTNADLFSLGLSGGQNSVSRRQDLCTAFGLPPDLSSNALLEALRMLGITKDDVENAL